MSVIISGYSSKIKHKRKEELKFLKLNVKVVYDGGLIELKTGEVASLIEVKVENNVEQYYIFI